jgi:hypothetical protein
MTNLAHTKVVELDRGLFLIRYAGSAAPSAPVVMIACEHGSERTIVLLSPPGYSAGMLERPGDALVVQAHQPGRLSVRVQPSVPNGSREADVSIERLGRTEERADDHGWSRESALELVAHVSRLGDIVVPAGEWIAGPANPARIEGLAFRWRDRSRYVGLKYGVRVGGRTSTLMWGNGDGSFVGTRGQARPITEVRFELEGSADRHDLVVEALFANGTPVRAEGRSISLAGPSGREPLVGLRLELVEVAARESVSTMRLGNATSQASSVNATSQASGGNEWSSGRVRVFRSSSQVQR